MWWKMAWRLKPSQQNKKPCQNREPAEQVARGELTGQKTVSAELETTTAEQTGLKITMVEKMEFKDHHIRADEHQYRAGRTVDHHSSADGAEKFQRPKAIKTELMEQETTKTELMKLKTSKTEQIKQKTNPLDQPELEMTNRRPSEEQVGLKLTAQRG